MSTKRPWFKFYGKDFLGDAHVCAMTPAARGVYITLLCHHWELGELPGDERKLARMAGMTLANFRRVWPMIEPCFQRAVRVRSQKTTHAWLQGRMACESEKANAQAAKNAANGARGGRPKNPLGFEVEPKKKASPDGRCQTAEEDPEKKAHKCAEGGERAIQWPKILAEKAPSLDATFAPLVEALRDWQEMRRKRRSPLTYKAAGRAAMKLARLAPNDARTAAAIVEKSADAGWTDLYGRDEKKASGKHAWLEAVDIVPNAEDVA